MQTELGFEHIKINSTTNCSANSITILATSFSALVPIL